MTAQVRQGRCPEAFRKPCPETIPGPGRQTARVAPSTVSRTGRTSLLAGCPGCRHSRHGDLSACRRGTKPSTSSNIAGRGTGPNKFDRMPACWDRSAEKIGWYARVICASTSIEEESGVREAQLVRRGFRVCPGDPEVAVGVAGVGRRHPHTGDATPSSAAHARCWMRRANPSNHLSLRWPPSCRCRTSVQPLCRSAVWETRRSTR